MFNKLLQFLFPNSSGQWGAATRLLFLLCGAFLFCSWSFSNLILIFPFLVKVGEL